MARKIYSFLINSILFQGNVDPDSKMVNLLESMFVDEGSKHNQHVRYRNINSFTSGIAQSR